MFLDQLYPHDHIGDIMRALELAPFDSARCPRCGGTGLKPVYCCTDPACGCLNAAVDYDPCGCGTLVPSETVILSWATVNK